MNVKGKWVLITGASRGVGMHIAAALADVVFVGGKAQAAVSNETDPFNPWKQTGNYRN